MSLILEALRKSEAERRRGQAPDLHAELAPVAARATAPAATRVWWVVVSLALLLCLAAWWWATRTSRSTAAPAPTSAPVSGAPVDTTPSQVAPAGRNANEGVPVDGTLIAATPVGPDASQPARPPNAAVVAPPPTPEPRAGNVAAAANPVQVAAPVAMLPAPAQPISPPPAVEVPARARMTLSLHLWNADPAQRFVVLDGQRVGEGDSVGDAKVVEITPDGVLLQQGGRVVQVPLR